MCEIYRIFSEDWNHVCDYSEDSMMEMFKYESMGIGYPDHLNGYYVGKRWLNVYVDMWKEDIRDGLLYKFELYESGRYPEWWLDSILGEVSQRRFNV